MPWTYSQSSGEMRAQDGSLLFIGYAGIGEGKNNPFMQGTRNIGPLPQGKYTFQAPVNTQSHGPCVLWLVPDPTNNMLGRSLFGIHDDSISHPGMASQGCIIALANPNLGGKWVSAITRRQHMWDSGDHELLVVA